MLFRNFHHFRNFLNSTTSEFSFQKLKRVLAPKTKIRNYHSEFMKHSPRRPLVSAFALGAVALASSLFSINTHAALINGGFENNVIFDSADSAGGTATGGGETSKKYGDLNGWDTGVATNANVFATNDQSFLPLGGAGPHGGELAAVFSAAGVPYDGFISQVTSTVAGTWYTVGYWVATQGPTVAGPADNFLRVNWGGSISGDAITGGFNFTPGAIPVPTNWTHVEVFFQSSGNDRLSFTAGGAAGQEILLDDVTLVEAVPEVSSFGMLTGAGLLAFGAAARFRRREIAIA